MDRLDPLHFRCIEEPERDRISPKMQYRHRCTPLKIKSPGEQPNRTPWWSLTRRFPHYGKQEPKQIFIWNGSANLYHSISPPLFLPGNSIVRLLVLGEKENRARSPAEEPPRRMLLYEPKNSL